MQRWERPQIRGPGRKREAGGSGSEQETTAPPLRPHKNGKPPQSPLRRCFSTTAKLLLMLPDKVLCEGTQNMASLRYDDERSQRF